MKYARSDRVKEVSGQAVEIVAVTPRSRGTISVWLALLIGLQYPPYSAFLFYPIQREIRKVDSLN